MEINRKGRTFWPLDVDLILHNLIMSRFSKSQAGVELGQAGEKARELFSPKDMPNKASYEELSGQGL